MESEVGFRSDLDMSTDFKINSPDDFYRSDIMTLAFIAHDSH